MDQIYDIKVVDHTAPVLVIDIKNPNLDFVF